MRLCRWLLRLYPRSLRDDYGEAMEETFGRRLIDARAVSGWRLVRVWTRELLGAVRLAIALTLTEQIMRSEMRYAARRLLHSPAFAAPAVLSLALAIGANASIFAIVHHVILSPLPYPDSDRVIVLDHGALGLKIASGVGVSEGLYFRYLDRAHTLEHVALYNTSEATLTGGGEPERIRVTSATSSLGPVLGVTPALGRWFTEAEGERGAVPVAVLSHGLWMRRFGGDGRIVGRSITLQGLTAEVIGVMPPAFAFPDTLVDAWMPVSPTRAMGFGAFAYSGVARIREGLPLSSVRADLDAAIAAVPDAYPEYPKTIGYNLHLVAAPTTLKDATVGSVSRAL
jgi:putative ABC transport system permease protein